MILVRDRRGRGIRIAVAAFAALAAFSFGAFAQSADVTLDNVTLTFGEQTYATPRLVVRGTTLTKPEIERILDTAASEPLADRIARLNASTIEADELTSVVTTTKERQETSYRGLRMGPVANGRVGTMSVSTGATRTLEEGREVSNGTFGRFELRDLDLGLAVSLFGQGGAPGAPLKPIYASFGLDDLRVKDRTGADIRFGRITGRDFRARPTAAGWLGSMKFLSETPDLAQATPETRRRALDTMAELMDAISIGSLEIADISIAGSGPGGAATSRVARIGFTGGGPDGSGASMQLDSLDTTTATGRVRIGSLGLGGLSAKPMLDAMRDSDAWLQGKPDPKAARAMAAMVSSFKLEKLDVGPGESGVPRAGEPGPAWQVSLAAAELGAGRPVDGLPSELKLALTNLKFAVPPNPDNDALRQLAGLGYDAVDGSLGLDLGWSEADQQITIRNLSAEGAGMGSVSLKAAIGGLSRDIFDRDTAIASVALIGAAAKSLDISVDNRGLFERIVAREANRQRRSAEDIRREYSTMAAVGIPAILGGSPSAKELGQAVARFAARPGRLTIQAKAKRPQGYGAADFAASPNPASVLDAFDVTARAE